MAMSMKDTYGRTISRFEYNRREKFRDSRKGMSPAAAERATKAEMKRRSEYRSKTKLGGAKTKESSVITRREKGKPAPVRKTTTFKTADRARAPQRDAAARQSAARERSRDTAASSRQGTRSPVVRKRTVTNPREAERRAQKQRRY